MSISSPDTPPKNGRLAWRRPLLFVAMVGAAVIGPFLFFGEAFANELMVSAGLTRVAFVTLAVMLLAADAVLPVPSSLVIVVVATKLGVIVGTCVGWVGLTAGVFFAALTGRYAGAPVASAMIPQDQLDRLKRATQTHAAGMLACLRSVPVLAEASVVIAAAMGISPRAIFTATLGPNLLISFVYAITAQEGPGTFLVVFVLTAAVSYLAWRRVARRADSRRG